MPSDVFELKVLVEASDWRDVAALMSSVDRALDPHEHGAMPGRRWSVVASRLADEPARELLAFVGQLATTDTPAG